MTAHSKVSYSYPMKLCVSIKMISSYIFSFLSFKNLIFYFEHFLCH